MIFFYFALNTNINNHHIIRKESWWDLVLALRQAIFAQNKVAIPALELTWSIAAACWVQAREEHPRDKNKPATIAKVE